MSGPLLPALSGRSNSAAPLLRQQQRLSGSRNAAAGSQQRPGAVDLLRCQQRRRRPPCRLAAPPRASSAAAGAGQSDGHPQEQGKKQGPVTAWRQWWVLEADPAAAAVAAAGGEAPQGMGSILNKVAGLLAPDRALLAGAVVFLLAAAAAELAIPHYITAAVFAAAKVGGSAAGLAAPGAVQGLLAGWERKRSLLRLALLSRCSILPSFCHPFGPPTFDACRSGQRSCSGQTLPSCAQPPLATPGLPPCAAGSSPCLTQTCCSASGGEQGHAAQQGGDIAGSKCCAV